MTRTTNSRLAGVTFLFYFVAGMASMNMPGRGVLTLFTSMSALVLGVTLYALTREQDPDLALLALTCRVVEAIPAGLERSAVFFAVGSTIFSWLLLRGRMIPAALGWLGAIGSALLVVILPLQSAGLLGGPMGWSASKTWLVWMPVAVFELALAVWLLVKGVAAPALISGKA